MNEVKTRSQNKQNVSSVVSARSSLILTVDNFLQVAKSADYIEGEQRQEIQAF
jgi:hypothetical protein